MNLVDRGRDFFMKASLVGTRGVVAVSGGADSLVLAHLLAHLLQEGLFAGLILGHVNHQLRGPDSDGDEAFVAGLAQSWNLAGLSCRTVSIDVGAKARSAGDNLEKVAREFRYGWLTELAQQEGARWVATGHSADDQAETVLHRLLRGSGLQGLTGIAPRRPLADGLDLVRPLLFIRRTDIHTYLHEHSLSCRQDSTNDDPRYTRNRLRHQLLPHLAEQYQPAIVEILARLADQARAAQTEIVAQARCLLAQAELPRAGDWVVFAPERLRGQPPLMICEAFRLLWQREKWPAAAMDQQAWLRLVALVEGTLKVHDFPGPIRARRRSDVLQIGPLASRTT